MALSKNQIKYIKSLQSKKFRQKYDNFILEGDKIAREILQQGILEIEAFYALPLWLEANRLLLQPHRDSIHAINEPELKSISSLTTPNQVLIVAKIPKPTFEPEKVREHLTLYLDGIQDPGNMGTILRIADWFGLPTVFCSKHCVDVYSPKVVQASMGALLRVKVFEIELPQLQMQLPDQPILGAVLEGEDIFKATLPPAGILVVGNEGNGISEATETLLTHRISIPAPAQSGAESLNAAIATGIIVAVLKNK